MKGGRGRDTGTNSGDMNTVQQPHVSRFRPMLRSSSSPVTQKVRTTTVSRHHLNLKPSICTAGWLLLTSKEGKVQIRVPTQIKSHNVHFQIHACTLKRKRSDFWSSLKKTKPLIFVRGRLLFLTHSWFVSNSHRSQITSYLFIFRHSVYKHNDQHEVHNKTKGDRGSSVLSCPPVPLSLSLSIRTYVDGVISRLSLDFISYYN